MGVRRGKRLSPKETREGLGRVEGTGEGEGVNGQGKSRLKCPDRGVAAEKVRSSVRCC